ncbi:MAG: HAD hydrolase-like protein [Candidatus Sericytochromatia bacterium]|nr:HAD hydrolase-like protein [Candidatus Tanganyikabacteria bacterium]
MAIVSNARQEARVARVAARFDVPYVHLARKPLPFGLISGARHLGVAPAELAVVGDRVLCDVVGGNLLGCLTILTRPLSPVERRPEQVLVRKIERLMLATQP